MKVYTCSEAVITEFIPTSTPIFKFYRDSGIQFVLFEELASKLKMLKEQVRTLNDISFCTCSETTRKGKITHVLQVEI